jgi:hypothetical protein
VDLNEEFSALHGPTLRQQADYVRRALEYVSAVHNQTVTIVGHSMGGIVGRLAAGRYSDTIYTLSTPHTLPPAPLDIEMAALYRSLRPQDVVSYCGGVSDTQVVSDACAIDFGTTIYTTGLAGAWTGADHQAMVWCHQIRNHVAAMERWEPPPKLNASELVVGERPGDGWHPLPWVKDTSKPFPLPGAGIGEDEVAWWSGSGHSETRVGREWTGTSGLSQTVRFDVTSSSLLAYRLEYDGKCERPPLFVQTARCGDVSETRYQPTVLHNHIVNAPFLPRSCEDGIEVSWVGECVTRVAVKLDWRLSLGKMLLRYRMALLSWPLGWVALGRLGAVQTLGVLALLAVGSAITPQDFFVGLDGWIQFPVVLVLGVWSLGVAALGGLVRTEDKSWHPASVLCVLAALVVPGEVVALAQLPLLRGRVSRVRLELIRRQPYPLSSPHTTSPPSLCMPGICGWNGADSRSVPAQSWSSYPRCGSLGFASSCLTPTSS